MNIETLIIVLVLGVLVLTLLEGILAILRRMITTLDTWWIVFLAWALGIVLAIALGINIVNPWIAVVTVAHIITGLIFGGTALVIRAAVN